jgi:predicted RNA binding protein YcfA (HicA-like mRNA interferase family)
VSNSTNTRAPRVLAALKHIGWVIKPQSAFHITFARPGWPDFVFAFHESEEVGPRMLARVAKRTGLTPENFWARRGCTTRRCSCRSAVMEDGQGGLSSSMCASQLNARWSTDTSGIDAA